MGTFPYNRYSSFLREKYGSPAYRVGVDGGFGCPNRDSGSGACYYCGEHGSRAPYLGTAGETASQVEKSLQFLKKRYGAEVFLLYFQAFSSTYAPISRLKRVYDEGLSAGDFRALIVSTRPDCVDEERARLLASYACEYREDREDREVWVELGLQSAHDASLLAINRGHDLATFADAFSRLRDHGIKLGVHLLFGIPGEDRAAMEETVRYVASLKPEGIKIHNLIVPKAAHIAGDFMAGELSLPCRDRHVGYCADAIELLPPETLIMRLSCDLDGGMRLFPRKPFDKTGFYRALEAELSRRGSVQGSRFVGNNAILPT